MDVNQRFTEHAFSALHGAIDRNNLDSLKVSSVCFVLECVCFCVHVGACIVQAMCVCFVRVLFVR